MTSDTATDPRQVLRELEERIRNGDTSVTPAALAKARDAAALAELHDEAAKRKAEAEAREAREREIEALRKDVDGARTKRLPALQEAYSAVVDALRSLSDQVQRWENDRTAFVARAKSLGVPDEADVMPSLGRRDWVEIAAEEAQGRFRRKISARIHDFRGGRPPIEHHELRTPKERERIDAIEAERAAKTEARLAARAAEKERDRREREALSRRRGDGGAAA